MADFDRAFIRFAGAVHRIEHIATFEPLPNSRLRVVMVNGEDYEDDGDADTVWQAIRNFSQVNDRDDQS